MPAPRRRLHAIESELFSRGEPVAVELSNLAEPAIGAGLTRRGYHLEGFENVLGLALPAGELPEPTDRIVVSASGEDELDAWIDVVVTVFASPDTEGVLSNEAFSRDVLEGAIADWPSRKASCATGHAATESSPGLRASEPSKASRS